MKFKKPVSILLVISCILMLVLGSMSLVVSFVNRSSSVKDNKERTAQINNLSEEITNLELKRASYNEDKAVYDEQLAQYTKKENDYKSTLSDYEYINDMLEASWDTYEQVKSVYDQGASALAEGKAQLEEGEAQLAQVKDALSQTQAAYEEGKAQYEQARAQLDAAEEALGIQKKDYETDAQVYSENIEDLNDIEEAFAELQTSGSVNAEDDTGNVQVNSPIALLRQQLLSVIKQLAEATGTTDLYNALEQQRQALENQLISFLMSNQDTSTLDGQMKSALAQIIQNVLGISQTTADKAVQLDIPSSLGISENSLMQSISGTGITSYASAEQQIEQTEQQLAQVKAQLDAYEQAQAQVEEGEQQLAAVKAQVEAGEQQLAQAKEIVDQFETQQAEQDTKKAELSAQKEELDSDNANLEKQRKNLSVFTKEERMVEDGKAKLLTISEIAEKIDEGDDIVNAAGDYVKIEKKTNTKAFVFQLLASLIMLAASFIAMKTVKTVIKGGEVEYKEPASICILSLFAYIFGKMSGYNGLFMLFALVGIYIGVHVFVKKYKYDEEQSKKA